MIFRFDNEKDFFEEFFSNNDSIFNNKEKEERILIPPADIYEDVEFFKFKIDLPGVKKEDISIKLKNNRLIVSGKRKLNFENPVFKYHRIERGFGNFHREFNLPENIVENEIQAELKDGELIISLPKKELNIQHIKNIEIK